MTLTSRRRSAVSALAEDATMTSQQAEQPNNTRLVSGPNLSLLGQSFTKYFIGRRLYRLGDTTWRYSAAACGMIHCSSNAGNKKSINLLDLLDGLSALLKPHQHGMGITNAVGTACTNRWCRFTADVLPRWLSTCYLLFHAVNVPILSHFPNVYSVWFLACYQRSVWFSTKVYEI